MLRTVPSVFLILLLSAFCSPALSFTCPKITTSDASQQMTALADEIRYHNQLYYEKAQPIISDAEYDQLLASLLRLEECFPELTAADSPTRTVGAGFGGGTQKVKHEQPMLSLSSSTDQEAVEALLKRLASIGELQLLVQPKVDGLPVELIYESGRLVSASTRGDGRSGEDVTVRVREIHGIPHRLNGSFPALVVVRGEIYADLTLLQNSRAGSAEEKYPRHPRHVAAGGLKTQKPDPAVVAALRLFPFELVTTGSARSDREALTLLSNWGFPVSLEQTHPVRTFAEVQALYRSYLVYRAQQPFAMDGIVVKVDDLAVRKLLGEGERAPFWAAAWKFPPETARTRVLNVSWTVGRTGRRTPVVDVAPVRLGGVLVTRVSLHNDAGIARLDIAKGDQVVVALVGDVIPQVLEVVGRAPRDLAADAVLPLTKPALDACLYDSPGCREQFLAKSAYFVSKSGLNIAGFGKGRLQKLVEAGLVTDLPSLFLLKTEAVAALPGFGQETARRLTAAIRAAGHSDPFRLVTALGIPGVGPKSIQRLARRFTSLDALLAAGDEKLTALAASDSRAARAVQGFFHSSGGKDLLLKFRELGVL